jgi:hypothetical protein
MKLERTPINLASGVASWLAPHDSVAVSWDQMSEREYFEDCLTHLLGDNRAGGYTFFIASDLNDPTYRHQFRKSQRLGHAPHGAPTDDVEPVGLEAGRKPVLLYLSRESAIPVSSKTASRFHTVFQTPLTRPRVDERIFPLQIGAFNGVWNRERPDVQPRQVNIFFAGKLTSVRLRALVQVADRRNWRTLFYRLASQFSSNRVLENLAALVSAPPLAKGLRGEMIFTSRWAGGVSPAQYKAQLLNARIVVCPRGNICAETFRQYEAASAACVIVTERLPEIYAFRGNPFIEVDSVSGWLPALQALEKEDDAALTMRSQATRQFWEDRLSPKATADYICRQLGSPTAL